MTEQEILQEFELSDRIVRCSCSLLSLKATDTNPDVGSCDHVDIVGAVTNRESGYLVFVML